ncbi:MAG: GNAT family N-acetyltransferase [Prevotella sp.]|nr:GNAT family N-acetyltransferase [Prevotella sp.]
MNYRLATIDDFQEIIGIYRSAIDTMNANGIMQWDEIYPTPDDIRKDIDTQEMYVGLKDSRICVAYTLNKESDAQYQNASWDGGINYIVVHRLCVAPKFQHQHIARDTMQHIHSECREYGIKAVRLDAFTENPYALALYKNLGYQKRGEAVWRKGKFNLYELIL